MKYMPYPYIDKSLYLVTYDPHDLLYHIDL